MKFGDLATHGHQAKWVYLFEVSELRNPWYLRLAWWLKDLFFPRQPLEAHGLIKQGQQIQKIGTGYHDPTLPGGPTHATRRDGSMMYRYRD